MIFGRWAGLVRIFRRGAVVGALITWVWAAQVTPNTRDTLVYKDGDRVQGKVIESTPDVIVFKADRFGELRVPARDAVVIRAEKPVSPKPEPAAAVAATKPAAPPSVAATEAAERKAAATEADKAEEERLSIWDRFSPSVLTARVRNYFGPWHGRLSFATEVVSDVAERNNLSYEGHLQRKWKVDEVQLNGRYDYSETNDVASADILKVWGQYRHTFNEKLFAHYRPTAEWNRASKLRGLPNDYVLLQQELGLGYQLLTKPSRKMRVGLSQNLFDTWNTAPAADHLSRGVVSTFEETELALPWRMTLSQRGVWYPASDQPDGWENRIDLNKKLTETLSTSLRHEIRRNNPDGTAQDFTRLRLLFGLDF